MSRKKSTQLTVAAVVAGLVAAGGMVSKTQIARADDSGASKASSADGCNGKDGCGGKKDTAKESCAGKSHDKCSKDKCKTKHHAKKKVDQKSEKKTEEKTEEKKAE